jgi:hypothetical protein
VPLVLETSGASPAIAAGKPQRQIVVTGYFNRATPRLVPVANMDEGAQQAR